MRTRKQSSRANESVEDLLQRAINKTLLTVIKEEVQRMDPLLPRHGPAFRTAVILMAAACLGLTNIDSLVALTQYSRSFVVEISDGMRASGLWTDGAVCREFFFEGDQISPRLWVGCLVAAEIAVVSKAEDGTWTVRRVGQLEFAPQNSGPASQS
jgi:hypothetical protein